MAQDHHQAVGPELLSYRHTFGLKVDVSRAVHFVEEAQVMYPCGHKVVFYNTETREQELIHGTPSSQGITALCLTPNRKYVAIAEKMDRAFVSIYDAATLRRRKTLQHPDMLSSEIVYVAFSADSKVCLTQGGGPDWLLVVWSFDRTAKPVATYKMSTASVYQVDFSPHDSSLICASGDGMLKFLRVAEGQLKTVQHNLKREPQNYMCHCWLPEDRFVVATDTGDIYLFEGFEFRSCLQRPLKTTTSAPPNPDHAAASQAIAAPVTTINIDPSDSINSIMAFSKGFVCGCANGVLCVFERSEDDPRELYKCSKVFRVAETCVYPMTHLAVSPSEESLCCSTKDAQLYTFTLSNTDILKDDATTFELLTTSFHGPGPSGSARINGIDVCVWKPLVVTCGDDRTLRVWNYRERSVELVKQYDEDVLSVALHPSGLYALAGFADKIRLVSLLLDDVRTVREISVVKGCRECSFSHGGHLFAIANHSVVQVFNTYTCETTAYLRGHTGKVTSVRWARNDRKIVSAGSDGAVFVWKVKEGIKDSEQSVPRLSYQAAVTTPDVSKIFTLADDDSLREHSVRDILKTKACDTKLSSCVELSSTQRLLFVGCGADTNNNNNDAPGFVQVHAVINNWEASSLPTKAYQCSAMEIACLKLSRDGSLLFAGGNDGSLCIFEVHDIDQRGVVRARTVQQESVASSSLGAGGGSNAGSNAQQQQQESSATICVEEVLVTKSDICAKSSATQELGNKVEELTLNNDYQLRLKDMKYKDRITEMTDKFSSELEADASRCERLADEKRKMEEGYDEKFKALDEKHKADYSELERTYEAKIVAEVQRYQLLVKQRDMENAQREEENRETVDSHSATVKQVTADFETQIKKEQEAQKALGVEKEDMSVQFEKTKALVEADADQEVIEINVKYEAKLSAERELTSNLKEDNASMKKRHSALTKDVDDQKEEIRSLHDKEKELLENIKGLEKDIQGHKKEIREREETIADKEKRIYDLKKKNQELEKFKFVLDYKIKELKRQIEPRESEIADMRKQVEEMDLELDQYHKSNSALDLVIGELRLKMDGMQKEIETQKLVLRRADGEIVRFRRDLADCAAYCLSPSPQTSAEQASQKQKELKARVRDLHADYVLAKNSDDDDENFGAARRVSRKGDEIRSSSSPASKRRQHDVHVENNRQREHLERNVNALKRKISRDMKMYVDDRARLVDESTVLIEDMNALRIESHDLELKERTLRERRQATTSARETVTTLEARIELLQSILSKTQGD